MVRKSAWFLNFDAEEELARPVGYTPSRAVLARSSELIKRVQALLGESYIVLAESHSERIVGSLIGMAWCPTPRARSALRKAGAVLLPAPSLNILRAVNHRGFSAALGQTLPGARYVRSRGEVEEVLAGHSPTGQWLLKRPFGFAGRGRLKIEAARFAETGSARGWIEASLRASEGIQVEPWVLRLGDFALHGYITRSGELVLGAPTQQECDEVGAWRGSVRAPPGELTGHEVELLFEHARLTGAALRRAGYVGPFGIDAFRWKGEAGEPLWNPRCEINARYSMGWATGMGALRPDLDEADR